MRLLVIEDDSKIAGFVCKGLKESGFVVDHAGDGQTGLGLAGSEVYACIVIDIMLPRMDGLSVIERLRKQKVNTPVLILSAKRSLDDRVLGLHRGGDDYLTKPFAFAELLARIQALLRRSAAQDVSGVSTLEIHDLSLNLLSRTVHRQQQKIHLQPKEFALLEYLLRNAGRVVSKTMIIEQVWDYNFDPHTNVVESRVCRLRDKVDKGFDTPLIHTVRGLGYILTVEQR